MMEYHSTANPTITTNTSVQQHYHSYNASCAYCNHFYEDDMTYSYTFGEDSFFNIPTIKQLHEQEHEDRIEPYKYTYLLNLMTAPDMSAYLGVATDDIYALPIHLQRLISEAKEEMLLSSKEKKTAQLQLERVRTYIWQRSDGDFSHLMTALSKLVSDEGELDHLLSRN